jgi:hypothetical protein
MYDMMVENPSEDFLLPIKIYVNKTGKTSGITSACGEPVLISTPLLKKSVREQLDAREVLIFIHNLEKGSSAKKRQESQCKLEKGRGYRNYHRCLGKGLESVLTEITQPCVHTYDGLFICQLYSLPDLLEGTTCKEDTPLTLPFCIVRLLLTVDNSDMN